MQTDPAVRVQYSVTPDLRMRGPTGPCPHLRPAVMLGARARRPRHLRSVAHAWHTAPGAALLGTACSWRGIVPSTHLAREGRMTVTMGRRELLAALGGAAAAWPLAARGRRAVPASRSWVLAARTMEANR